MGVTSFKALHDHVAKCPQVGLAVAGGNDPDVLKAVLRALDTGMIASAVITGDKAAMAAQIPPTKTERLSLIDATTSEACALLAVATVRDGRADILMKGHVDSATYLRAVVHRDTGIRGAGTLSNVTVAEMPSCQKLVVATDNGIVPMPDLEQKRQIILNTRSLFQGLGIAPVRVAAIAATEKPTRAMPATLDADQLSRESRAGELPGFLVEGPFGYDVAFSAEAAGKKGLTSSEVAGQADLILFSNIDAANAVAKSWKLHGAADTGSIVLGARAPVLLNSRSDGIKRRLNALALAIVVSQNAPDYPLKENENMHVDKRGRSHGLEQSTLQGGTR